MNTVKNEKSSKKILELSDDENSIIVYQDEVHFHVQSTVTCGWYKKGSQPEIGSLPGRDKISYSGFVLPESGELFVNKPPLFNFQTTLESIRAFLQAHPVPHGKKYVLIMDNASWHKKAARLVREDPQGEYRDISSAVTFLFLPPYSPDLNPIEQVWRITRRENTHNVFFASKTSLEQTLDKAFLHWENQTLNSSHYVTSRQKNYDVYYTSFMWRASLPGENLKTSGFTVYWYNVSY